MIDDYAKGMELVYKMEASLPIPVRPTGGFIRAMKAQRVKIARDQELLIKQCSTWATKAASRVI
jgi:hypothetical protein